MLCLIIIITIEPALCVHGHACSTKVHVILLHVVIFNHNYNHNHNTSRVAMHGTVRVYYNVCSSFVIINMIHC